MSTDETIYCDRADEVGSELQKAMMGKNCAELTLKYSAKVLPLSSGGSKGGGGQRGPDPPPLSGKYNVLVNYIRICLARYTM